MESLNLTTLLSAVRDRYARAMGSFELFPGYAQLGSGPSVWQWMRARKGLQMRILYLTTSNVVRDMIIRQGVHKSAQDGTVAGIGHSMANETIGTLSAWTCVFGDLNAGNGDGVNNGTGYGYRTVKSERILVVNIHVVDDRDEPTAIHSQHVTETGQAMIDFARAL